MSQKSFFATTLLCVPHFVLWYGQAFHLQCHRTLPKTQLGMSALFMHLNEFGMEFLFLQVASRSEGRLLSLSLSTSIDEDIFDDLSFNGETILPRKTSLSEVIPKLLAQIQGDIKR